MYAHRALIVSHSCVRTWKDEHRNMYSHTYIQRRSSLLRGEEGRTPLSTGPTMYECMWVPHQGRKSTCLYGNVYALCSSGTVGPTSGAEYDRRTRAADEETDDWLRPMMMESAIPPDSHYPYHYPDRCLSQDGDGAMAIAIGPIPIPISEWMPMRCSNGEG